jgi:glutamate-1-semialdehyde 2,1-aminomutase
MVTDCITMKQTFERSRLSLAGGVGSAGRISFQPFFIREAKGSRVIDIEGKEYIDYMLAFGPLVLGHAPNVVVEAIKNQLEKGTMYGTGFEGEYLLAEEVKRVVPCAGLVRFTNSGTESVQMALRVARAYTGREKVIKFEGHFHGWADNIYVSVKPTPPMGPSDSPKPLLGTPGQSPSVLEDLIILPFNDLDIVERTLKQKANQIAAVILEPVMFYSGCILPQDGYLEGLRRLTQEYGVVLIFDEVITGFRLALGGAQEYFGVIPDLAIFAKGFAAGLPMALYCGRKEIMDLVASNTVHHMGTYNANPLCVVGALAVLKELCRDGGRLLKHISVMGTKLKSGLNRLFEEKGQPMRAVGPDPVFTVISPPLELRDYRDTLNYDLMRMARFNKEMMARGVWFLSRGNFFLSAAHTEEDIKQTLAAATEAIDVIT